MRQQGFTLIEMMMVVAIIGILSAIAIPMFHSYRAKTYDVTAEANLRQVMSFEEAYFGVHFNYVPIDDTAPGPRTVYITDTDNFKIGDQIRLRVDLATMNNLNTYTGMAYHQHGKHSYYVTGSVGIIFKR